MKIIEQNRAIAKAIGITVRDDDSWFRNTNNGCEDGITLPNYTNDLNAMHEVEKVLGELQWVNYCKRLLKIVEPDPMVLEICHYWNLLHATAAQRAEAFLRTLNLWKP